MIVMSNVDILSGIIVDWAKPMIDDIASQAIGGNEAVARANAWIRKYFPVSESYSIWQDLSFLALPVVNMLAAPMIGQAISRLGLRDEDVPQYAAQVAEAMVAEAETKGKVQLLERYSFSLEDMRKLRDLIRERYV